MQNEKKEKGKINVKIKKISSSGKIAAWKVSSVLVVYSFSDN
jgi:hypothetical protein